MPAKRIIILDLAAPGRYRYLLWADVPAARQVFYADANKTSAWKDASAGDLTALRTGAVVEYVDVTANVENATLAQVQAGLQNRWTDFQNGITNNNFWQRYGSFWDGTSWTAGGVS